MDEDHSIALFKEKLPKSRVPKAALDTLEKSVWHGKLIGVACSGGLDSICLVSWLLAHFPQSKPLITLLHFNHNCRGEESDTDQAFVEALAQKSGIHVSSESIEKIEDHPSEATLREARMKFFSRVVDSKGLDCILTGHHADDRIETLLMRLSRGSNIDGLVAPKASEYNDFGLLLVRPFLNFQKRELMDVLVAVGQVWKEDKTNLESDYYRNFVRNELLPRWKEKCSQNLDQTLLRSVSSIEEDAEALNFWATQTVQSIEMSHSSFPLASISTLPAAVARRCIWLWLNQRDDLRVLSHEDITRILEATPGDSWSIQPNKDLLIEETRVAQILDRSESTESWPFQFKLSPGQRLFLPTEQTLVSDIVKADPSLIERITNGHFHPESEVYLDLEKIGGEESIKVSFWEAGMKYQPLGMKNYKKLQDAFTDRKIPSVIRKRLPIMSSKIGEILWCPGLPPADLAAVNPDTKWLLRLTYQSR